MNLLSISSLVAALTATADAKCAIDGSSSALTLTSTSTLSPPSTPTSISISTPSSTSTSTWASESESDSSPESASASSLWLPTAGTTWQIELLYALNDTSIDVDVYDIDLFTNSASTISSLHSAGRKVICYFDAGALGTWEPDVSEFEVSDLGSVMNGWPDEKWLNITSPNVRIIMAKRLDLAQQKGCDGVDPDNVDAYNNGNGLGLTQDDAIDYINWMAGEAHARGLSIGLKNALAVIDSVIDNMQWSVDELCVQYNECSKLFAFTKRNMPVFHIEYPKGSSVNNNDGVTSAQKTAACAFDTSNSFSTLIKNILLDNWRETC